MKKSLWVGGVAVVAVVAGGAYWFSQQDGGAGRNGNSALEAPLATPVGVTVQEAVAPAPTGQAGYQVGAGGRVYADAKGLTLYTYDKDTQPGKAACTGDCAKAQPPLIAAPNAKPLPGWSIVSRDDGAKQWAYQGKPLYVSAKDAKVGDAKGEGGDGWHKLAFQPGKGAVLPDAINVLEITNAGGQAFVDTQGKPLYTFEGDPVHDKTACTNGACPNHWIPLEAAQLARSVGDFTVASREDGISQWAYKGRLLYTFDGDRLDGDANGNARDKRWHVALLQRYFMPSNVGVTVNYFGGYNLVTATGMTIYQRGRWRAVNGGHNVRTGTRDSPIIGRTLGLTTCDAGCTRTWPPLKAPADAQPSGFWSVVTRDDGTKQWAYLGYPLYTYSGDAKPGDMNGNDITDYMAIGKDIYLAADAGAKAASGANAMLWHVTVP